MKSLPTKRSKMIEYMSDHQDLFYELQLNNLCSDMLLGDVTDLDTIDNEDDTPENYFGFNFTGVNRTCMLFFTGDSTHFPGIYVGFHDLENELDKCPIYIMDSEKEDNEEVELVGNFKMYLTLIYDTALQQLDENENKELITSIKKAKKKLHKFSDIMIENTSKLVFSMIKAIEE